MSGGVAVVKRKEALLQNFLKTGRVKASADILSISVSTVYSWLRSDSEFKQRLDELRPIVGQMLLDEAIRRGMDGVEKAVFHNGKRCDNGKVVEYSDRLLSQLLKGLLPDTFGDRLQLEAKLKGRGLTEVSTAELLALLEAKDDE